MENQMKPNVQAKHELDLNGREEAASLFTHTLGRQGLILRRERTQVLQINVGAKCNQTCSHCHVNAGPARTEIMTRHTMDRILAWLPRTNIQTVDITGGAPEINPNFRYLVERIKALAPGRQVIDRCNLTVLAKCRLAR
jgi:MoaA/NifB/PqqE/SkfB family radical SAM enzyme